MNFEQAYDKFLRFHLASRSGERRGRLERGHQHGEMTFLAQVWWPLQGGFDGLHPEYEVQDWRGRSYFGDFAYFTGPYRFIIEIKGYGPHVRDMDRKRYCDELNRELFLQAMGYRVISFAYDDVAERPEQCMMLLRMLLNRFRPAAAPAGPALLLEKEVLRYATALARPVRPVDLQKHMNVDHRTAVKYLAALKQKGWFTPVYAGARIMRYELKHMVWEQLD